MIKVIYSKTGQPISDFHVYDYVDRVIESHKSCPNIITSFSSELYLLVFGLRVLEGKVSADEVEFYFEDEKFKKNKLEFDSYLGILDLEDKKIGFYSEVIDKSIEIGYEKMKQDRCNNT